MSLELTLLPEKLAVCRLDSGDESDLRAGGGLFSVTRTANELSVICPEEDAPDGAETSGGWRAFEVSGPLDHTATGVLASLATPLAEAEVALFPLATFDTDYVLVREADLDTATEALTAAGHKVESRSR
ncbi:MAG TPA: ACT domain-containing protein [Thermoleophilaceae bacterium]|nr:ACT domain-containing protein [Thermoleophilaceae bacterium]